MRRLAGFVMLPILSLVLAPSVWGQAPATGDRRDLSAIVDIRKIWDRAPHNAFTDLVRFKDRWYCVFREGQGHVSPDGAIRVITSDEGRDWTSAALVTLPGADLRDPKITITPDGRLMIVAAAARDRKPNGEVRHQSMVWFSRDGRSWDEGRDVGEPDFWLWRVVWHKDAALGVGYGTTSRNPFVRLYQSRDGAKYEPLVDRLFEDGSPNESGLVFLADGTCLCLLRRDGGTRTGQLGSSRPPYTRWTWRDLGVQIGGPQLIQLPDGRLVACVRLYDKKVRTALGWIDPSAGRFTEFLALPSGGDTSYPGLVWHDGMLWISYYSSHEGKTSIYLARVKLKLN